MHRLVNTYDQLHAAVEEGIIPKEKAVALMYQPNDYSRGGSSARMQVASPFFKTDPRPEAPWYNYNTKTFLGKRSESQPLAIEWATKEYGITEWKRNRMGDLVPAIVQKKFPLPKRT